MKYIFRKTAKSVAYRNFSICTVMVIVAFAVTILYFKESEFPTFIFIVSWVLCLITGGVFLRDGIRLFRSGGVWRVEIDEDRLIWTSPDNEVDKTFLYKLSDIASTKTIQKRGKNKQVWWYFLLILKDGGTYELPQHAGIDPKKVIRALQDLGVENEFEYVPRDTVVTIGGVNY